MEAFWKAAAVMILTVILGAALGKMEKDFSAVLTVLACCVIMTTAVHYLWSVFDFLWQLERLSEYQNTFPGILLQLSAVALMTEITSMIGADTGNQTLGKAMQILGNAVMLCLSLPLLESFLSIVQEIMGYL